MSQQAAGPNGTFDSETYAPYCCSLKDYEEVVEWSPEHDEYSVASIKLPSGFKIIKNRRQTYVIHDSSLEIYSDDKFTQGTQSSSNYRFCYWQLIDTFIYYGRTFVTIPPPSWTNAAHKHGVAVLGSVNTELGEGTERYQRIIASERSYTQFADILVAMSLHYGFDGWLINFAVVADPEQIERTKDFLALLKNKLHKSSSPHSQVIWYDSMTKAGKVDWQSELNERNKCFFDVTDGMIIHYAWKNKNLQHSAKLAFTDSRLYDVIIGIDAYGRGLLDHAGFSVKEGIRVTERYDLSVAIFGIGWAYKKFGKESFTANEIRFWNILSTMLHSICKVTLPFTTTFCQGFGDKFFQNGLMVTAKPWTNLSAQNLQPFWVNGKEKITFERLDAHWSDAFNGGSCVKIQADLTYKSHELFRLFNIDVECNGTLIVAVTMKKLTQARNTIFRIGIIAHVEGRKDDTEFLLCEEGDNHFLPEESDSEISTFSRMFLSVSSSTILQREFIIPMLNSEYGKYFPDHVSSENNGWKTRFYVLPLKGGLLKAIDLRLVNNQKLRGDSNIRLLLGQIQILPLKKTKDMPPVDNLQCITTKPTQDSYCALLTWNYPDGVADHFNIFHTKINLTTYSEKKLASIDPTYFKFRGSTHLNFYKVGKLERTYAFKVQVVTKFGYVYPIDDSPTVACDIIKSV